MYDASHTLLYVGRTINPGQRYVGHRDRAWWDDVAYITLEHWPSAEAVAEMEYEAIRRERPIHNIVHNDRVVDAPVPFHGGSMCYACERELPSFHEWAAKHKEVHSLRDELNELDGNR
jgi:hypothetical protein